MYEDRNTTEYQSVVIKPDDVAVEIDNHFKTHAGYDDVLPPVFEPIMMTENEFKNLPEFEGF